MPNIIAIQYCDIFCCYMCNPCISSRTFTPIFLTDNLKSTIFFSNITNNLVCIIR